jgi:hypothetical protein
LHLTVARLDRVTYRAVALKSDAVAVGAASPSMIIVDAAALPFANDSFDVIVCSHVLQVSYFLIRLFLVCCMPL